MSSSAASADGKSAVERAGGHVPERTTPLRIICGPTGAGKSAIAMALAERHRLTIVSADSRQIYRGFDVGTAKPSPADRARVPHVGIDVADPAERWSAARFAEDAAAAIAHAGAGRSLVVGGTGFYLRALVAPLDAVPPLDAARRAALAAVLGDLTTEALRRWVRVLDPPRAPLGRAQLLRAAEIALLAGVRLSDLHGGAHSGVRRGVHRGGGSSVGVASGREFCSASYLVVDPGAVLHAQIAIRLDAMLAAGWADEVRGLERTVPPEAPAWQACGYSAMRQCVAGALEPAVAREAILIATRQYAKRQRTWFRHQLDEAMVTRVDPHDPSCDEIIERWWRGGMGE